MRKKVPAKSPGARLKETRVKLGMKQKQLAVAVGVNPSYVCDIERGRVQPSLKFLLSASAVLNVDFNWLAKGQEPGTPKNQLAVSTEGSPALSPRGPEHYQRLMSAIRSDTHLRFIIEELTKHQHTKDLFYMVLKSKKDGPQILEMLLSALRASIELTSADKQGPGEEGSLQEQ